MTRRGPIVRPNPPPAINKLIPNPVLWAEACATIPGEAAWNMVELVPAINKINANAKPFGAMPNKHMSVAVIAGDSITKYFAPVLSAMYPINGLKIEGILANVLYAPADVRESERFSIIVGRRGGKNDVKVSWKK